MKAKETCIYNDCTLFDTNHNMLQGDGHTPCDVMVIGEFPHEKENKDNAVFVSIGGDYLCRLLYDAGISRNQLYMTYLVKCFPANYSVLKQDIDYCMNYLKQEIEVVKPRLILLLGNTVLKELLGLEGITKYRGGIIEKDGIKYLPTLHPAAVMKAPALANYLIADTQKVSQIIKNNFCTLEKIDKQYLFISNIKDITKLFTKLKESNILYYDIETTGLNWMTDKMIGIGLSADNKNYYWLSLVNTTMDVTNIGKNWIVWDILVYDFICSLLKELFSLPELQYVAHNGKFDNKFISMLGIHVETTFDTMLMHHLLNEEVSHGLKDLAKDVEMNGYENELNVILEKNKKNKFFNYMCIDGAILGKYCNMDVDCTSRLHYNYIKELNKYEYLFNDIVMPLSNVLMYMELTGVCLNQNTLVPLGIKLEQDIVTMQEEIYSLVGERFNIGSGDQLGNILIHKLHIPIREKTPTGKIKTNEEVLSKYSANSVINKVLTLKKMQKIKNTYVDGMLKLLYPDGRLHTNYSIASDGNREEARGTVTGRISSGKPNLQNIPRADKLYGKDIRNAFIPAEGCVFIDIDFSQMELRVMAHYSKDENLCSVYLEGKDLHKQTAAGIFRKDVSLVTKEERQIGKGVNFAIVYGEYNEYTNLWYKTYPRVKQFQNDIIKDARKNGQVVSMFGRVRRLPAINHYDSSIRAHAERQAINSLVQGTAADLHALATIRVFNMLCKDYVDLRQLDYSNLLSWVSKVPKIVLTVHDNLVLEVPIELADEIYAKVVKEMIIGVEDFRVPLEVEGKIISCWE